MKTLYCKVGCGGEGCDSISQNTINEYAVDREKMEKGYSTILQNNSQTTSAYEELSGRTDYFI